MDVQEKRKLDSERLAGQLAQVKARTRPWRSILALVHLDTGEGVLALPNSQALAAAVGPLPAAVPGRPGWPA